MFCKLRFYEFIEYDSQSPHIGSKWIFVVSKEDFWSKVTLHVIILKFKFVSIQLLTELKLSKFDIAFEIHKEARKLEVLMVYLVFVQECDCFKHIRHVVLDFN